MKKIISTLSLFVTFSTLAVNYVPLNVKAGLWRYEVLENSAIDQMLMKVQEAQRAMMKAMMKEKMGSYESCQNVAMLKDPKGKFKEAIKNNPEMKDCDFNILKSTAKFNHSKIQCPNEGPQMDIKVTVNSNTEQLQNIIGNTPVPNTKIKVKATWIGECDKKEKK